MSRPTDTDAIAGPDSLTLPQTGDDPALAALLELISQEFEVAAARVHTLDAQYQHSLGGSGRLPHFDAPRDQSLCAETVQRSKPFVVPDFRADPDFAAHPLTVAPPYIRFYAGAPLRGPDGTPMGALCLIDTVPRHDFGDPQADRLRRYARAVEAHVNHAGASRPAPDPENAGVAAADTAKTASALPERESVYARLHAMVEAARQSGEALPLSVMVVQLDDVAELRASGQPSRADRLLEQINSRLGEALPDQVEMNTWDLDEVLIWAPSNLPGCDRDALFTRITDHLHVPIAIDGHEFRVRLSAAIATAPDDGDTVDELLSALRRLARQGGEGSRIRVAYSGDGRAELARSIDLAHRLDEALSRGDVGPWYQAKVCARRGTVVGLEALARWKDPELGWISPGEFIPVAERTRRSSELSTAMIGAVCNQIAQWRFDGIEVPPVAVNISPQELNDPDFVDRITTQLEVCGLEGPALEIEMTEHGFSEDLAGVSRTLAQLAGEGVRCAIDDFGTGYSSLLYLQALPAHQLKIDRSFVTDIGSRSETHSIVDAMVRVAAALGMDTVAEGVEHHEELEFLRALGVDQVQGFLHSQPAPASTIRERLTHAGPAAPPG